MRFVIYKNSVLATICSMFGAAFIVMAVTSMVSGELGILPGIGVIAAALGFMWLGDIISTKKAERKRKKAQQAATAAVSSPTASYAQPQQSAPVASHAASAVQGKRVNISAVFAAILFLLAALLEFIVLSDTYSHVPNDPMNLNRVSMVSMGLLMAIAALRSRHIQQVSVLFILCFLGLALGNLDVALIAYRNFGSGRHPLYVMSALKAAAYFLLALFALLSTRKIKESCGGIVRWLWFVPMLPLVLGVAMEILCNDSFWTTIRVFARLGTFPGLKGLTRPSLLQVYAVVLLALAVFISGFCFHRLCRKDAAVYTQSEPQPVYYAPPVQPAQPQPEPVYSAPEPPKQPEPAPKTNDQDVQKQIQAYKDLLDCGILTQEECEQKIRELTQEYYGG
ncbi:MAG: hypothetical protein SPH82_12440 [Eubacteriales bacterium]|nr:hypothetical protein [Eubacteriales bacterium]